MTHANPRRSTRHLTLVLAAGSLVVGLVGCGADDGAPPTAPATTTASPTAPTPVPTTPAPRTIPVPTRGADIATNLEVPWGIAALPDGEAVLVAERMSGRIDRVPLDGGTRTTLGRVPVNARGEGGLLGLTVSPDYANDRTIVVYFTTARDNRVARIRINGNSLGAVQPIITGIPAGTIHNGGRLGFGPDGKLWISTGDSGQSELAQQRDSLAGKVLRAEPDGGVPSDNPFDTLVWTYGHRNVQGIAWDSRGQAWATEFGSNEFDELNLLRKGANYGWPLVEGASDDGDFVAPIVTWPTSEASPSGLAIVDDIAYIAALRGQRLWQVPLTGDTADPPIARLDGTLGRLRSVIPAPDGNALLLTTSNRDGRGSPQPGDDRLLRVPLR